MGEREQRKDNASPLPFAPLDDAKVPAVRNLTHVSRMTYQGTVAYQPTSNVALDASVSGAVCVLRYPRPGNVRRGSEPRNTRQQLSGLCSGSNRLHTLLKQP